MTLLEYKIVYIVHDVRFNIARIQFSYCLIITEIQMLINMCNCIPS